MKAWMAMAAAMLVGVGSPGLDRVVPLPVYAAEQAADQAARVLAEMRKALGGAKVEQVKSLSVEGPFRRTMGQRQMEGSIALVLAGSDRMHRLEEMEMGPATIERTQVLDGEASWTDLQNRGGMGGGMQIMMRDGPPGGPGGPADPAEAEKRRTAMFRAEMQRWMFVLLGSPAGEVTYAGVAESPDGKADMIEMKDARGQALRLFVDQQTHLPLMLSYSEIRPRIMMQGGPGGRRGGPGGPGSGTGGGPGGGAPGAAPGAAAGAPPPAPGAPGAGAPEGPRQRPSPEEMQRRMAAMPPPKPSAMRMTFEDFATVDGVKLPKRITLAADNEPVEEWTIEKIKVNPALKADFFQKK